MQGPDGPDDDSIFRWEREQTDAAIRRAKKILREAAAIADDRSLFPAPAGSPAPPIEARMMLALRAIEIDRG